MLFLAQQDKRQQHAHGAVLYPLITGGWSFFNQSFTGHGIKGPQPFANILSTGTPTAIVGKWTNHLDKRDWMFFVQFATEHVIRGLQTAANTLSTYPPTEIVRNLCTALFRCGKPFKTPITQGFYRRAVDK